MRPVPPETENADALPVSDHAPPTSAVPQPLATVRPNASAAYWVGAPAACVAETTGEMANASATTAPAAIARLMAAPSDAIKVARRRSPVYSPERRASLYFARTTTPYDPTPTGRAQATSPAASSS